jgi:cell division protein FtsB
MQPANVAMRKRTQIARANRVMFIWVAIISAIVGFALVGSIFLAQKLFFNEKVIAEKEKTVATLKTNNANIPDLEAQIRVLDTNQALIDSKAKPTDQAVQAILDALPSDANSLALGASLQNKLLTGIDGLTIQSLQVDPVLGVEQLATGGGATTTAPKTATSLSSNQITFRFAVSGSPQALHDVLDHLERSIRTIDVTSIRIESQGATELLSVEATAFYEPAVVVQLTDKLVKP